MTNGQPVLVIAFNRPDLTGMLLSRLRKAKPTKIYFAVDGPRSGVPQDSTLVRDVRSACLQESWDCPIFTRFQERNLGLYLSVTSAIDWFFETETEGIILEDDCMPLPGFFQFMNRALREHREDHRVWGVSGLNLVGDHWFGPGNSGLIGAPLVWGWGTWADRWKTYDRELQTFRTESRRGPGALWRDKYEFFAFDWHLRKLKGQRVPKTWDYQLAWTLISQNRLWLIPRDNLVENLGNRPDGTHRGRQPKHSKLFSLIRRNRTNLKGERNARLQQEIHRVHHSVFVPLWLNRVRDMYREVVQIVVR